MECNSNICMDNKHATMDSTSPGNVYSSIRERRKKNALFSDGTDVGSIQPQSRKTRTFFGQAADLVKEMGGVVISAQDASTLAVIERKMKILYDEAAEIDRRIAAQTARKHSHINVHEINESLVSETADNGFVTTETKWSNESFLGNASDDGSLTTETERKNEILFTNAADDRSMAPKILRKNSSFAKAAEDCSIIADRGKNTIDDKSIVAVSGKKLWFADAIDDGPKLEQRRRTEKKEGRTKWMKLVIILFLLLAEFVLPRGLPGLFEPSLTADTLRNISEESMATRRLSDRLDFVARKLSRIVRGQVMNCTGSESAWKLQQDGMLGYSYCTLYSSMVEEVSLWRFPSQAVAVIDRGNTDRSFTIMSGRMIEWFEGKTEYVVHQRGDSWTHEMLTASVVQMDEKTWILVYTPSVIVRRGGLVSWALRSLKWRTCGIFERGRSSFRSFLLPKINVGHIHGDFRTPT